MEEDLDWVRYTRNQRILLFPQFSSFYQEGSTAALRLEQDLKDNVKTIWNLAITDDSYFWMSVRELDGRNKYEYGYYNVPKGLSDYMTRYANHDYSLPPPRYVALGPSGQYFISLANGEFDMHGPQELHEMLCRSCGYRRAKIRHVSFGQWGVWCAILFDKNKNKQSIVSNGLPKGLHDTLRARRKEKRRHPFYQSKWLVPNPAITGFPKWLVPYPVEVSIGPNDVWFVKFDNGKWNTNIPEWSFRTLGKHEGGGFTVRRPTPMEYDNHPFFFVDLWDLVFRGNERKEGPIPAHLARAVMGW